MVRPKFLAASEKQLTMCYRASSVCVTAACSETDIDALWQVLFCLTEHDAEEDGEQCGGKDASLLDAVGDGEAVR